MNEGDRVIYRGSGGPHAPTEWTGTIASIDGGKVLLELDEPIPFIFAPEAVLIDAVDERMYLPETKVLAYGLAQALEDENALPSGNWRGEDQRIYDLDKSMDVRELMKFCKKNHPEEKLCWLHGIIMTAVPIDTKSKYFGAFEPLG